MSVHTPSVADLATVDDSELLERCRAGDGSAFADLYADHRDSAHRLATILGGSEGADELVAEAISRVFSQLRSGRGPTRDFRSYLHATIRNRYWDLLRHHQHEETASDRPWLLDGALPGADEQVPELDRNLAVSALATLPGTWQQVLWYLDVEGRKPAEVAGLLSISAAAVSSMAYRAREGLKQAYLAQHVIEQHQPRSRDCAWSTGKIGSFVRQELGPRATTKLTRHLDGCAQCALAVQEATELNTRIAGVLWPIVLAGGMAALEFGVIAPHASAEPSAESGQERQQAGNGGPATVPGPLLRLRARSGARTGPRAGPGSGVGSGARSGLGSAARAAARSAVRVRSRSGPGLATGLATGVAAGATAGAASAAAAARAVAGGPLGLALVIGAAGAAGAASAIDSGPGGTASGGSGAVSAWGTVFGAGWARLVRLGVGAPIGAGLLVLAVVVGVMARAEQPFGFGARPASPESAVAADLPVAQAPEDISEHPSVAPVDSNESGNGPDDLSVVPAPDDGRSEATLGEARAAQQQAAARQAAMAAAERRQQRRRAAASARPVVGAPAAPAPVAPVAPVAEVVPPPAPVTEVTAVPPSATPVAGCGTYGSVQMATTTGVNYQLSAGDGRQGVWTVTATAQAGYRLAAGSPSTFSGDLGAYFACPTLGAVSVVEIGPYVHEVIVPVNVSDPEAVEVSVRISMAEEFVLNSYASGWVCRFDGDGSVIPNGTDAAFGGAPAPGITCSRTHVPGAPVPDLTLRMDSVEVPRGNVAVTVSGTEHDAKTF